jgi:biopolymer transport protein ExbD
MSAFTGVMFVLFFNTMLIEATRNHHGIGPDLPKVAHATLIPRADRWDALTVAVVRDGSVYFGTDKVLSEDLPAKILEKLRDRSVERKIYIKADARAKYGAVEGVLDAIRSSRIGKIAFLVDERRPITLSH